MDKELKVQSAIRPEQKVRKRSEAQIEQWEAIRRKSTTVEDKDLNIEGVVRLTLSMEMQRFLGCVIGEHVSSEKPWTSIKKEHVEANLISENEKSEMFAVKEPLMKFPGTDILVGYIFCAEKPNQFYICTTEVARKYVLEMIAKNEADQERRVYNCIYRHSQEWIPLGSGKEVEDNQPKHARPLFEIQAQTAVSRLNQPVVFQDRNVDDVQDGYVNFDPRKHKYVTVMRRRTDVAVQAVPKEGTSVAQTVPPLPSNVWTQYEFYAEAQKEIEDEELAKNTMQFLREKSPEMADDVRYNSVFDLYKDDYPNLVTKGQDVEFPARVIYTEYQTFMDIKNCKGKVISAAAWHPMWTGFCRDADENCALLGYYTALNNYHSILRNIPEERSFHGIMACAYIDHHVQSDENEADVILQDVFSVKPVLIWSFKDALNPRLILRSPRTVHALQFCPYNENLLAGGCSNGQVVVWDLCDSLKKVEQDISLSPDKLKYRLALYDMMGWTRPTTSDRLDRFLNPVLISSLEFSPHSCIKDIKWLSPYYEVSHLGRYQGLKSNQSTALQFLTCSEDGSVFVWDLNAQWSKRPHKKKPKRKTQHKFIARDILSYRQLEIFKPHYKLFAENSASRGCMALSVLAVEAFPLTYLLQTQTDLGRKLSITERLSYKPELQEVTSYPESKIYIGSVEGHVIRATWEGYEFDPGETINSEALKFKSWGAVHDGPITALSLAPFNKDLMLSVGGKVLAIWKDTMKDVPVLWRRSCATLTSGAWSLFCPSMFYITRVDGAIEVWDFLVQSNKPLLVQSISGNALTGIYPSRLGPVQNVIGITDISGNFLVFLLPHEHMTTHPRNKKAVDTFFYREMECRNFACERQERWVACNADMLQAKKKHAEAEMKMRETEKRARERLEKQKKIQEEEELKKRKLKKRKDYAKEECARKHWNSEQEKYLINVLLGKKNLDVQTLVDMKAPLDQLKEDEKQKTLKHDEKMKEQDKLTERISVLFPEMVKDSLKADINVDVVLKDLEKTVNRFAEQYKEIEQKALMLVKNNTFEYEMNWKELLAEGKERRCIIDLELYRRTSRIERYNKMKVEHREKLHMPQEKTGESGKQRTLVKGILRQKKVSYTGQRTCKKVEEEKRGIH